MNNIDFKDISSKTWFSLLVDGCFKFYRKYEVLENYIKLLEKEDFHVYSFHCNEFKDAGEFEKEIAIKINNGKPKEFVLPNKEGNVLILKNFEEYFCNNFKEAISTLNSLHLLSWIYTLAGKKLIVFLNSNENSFNEFFNKIDIVQIGGIQSIRWIEGDGPKLKNSL
ncbi:hypothetical protein [Clostridium hydrogeniformans]|uniref:hypothetical protein n=1 Tax=Clostridium hydrogeniformans TaxID=349933 RepID=UPI00048014FA|nr:hypothetical protein [Clostridium hydrogeniformans]